MTIPGLPEMNRSFSLFAAGGVFILLFALSSCSLTSNLSDDEMLLKKNRIRVMSEEKYLNFQTTDLERYYRQKPNKRMFRLVPFHAAAYNFGERITMPDSTGFSPTRKWIWKRREGLRSWIINNGEAPVVLDTAAADRTVMQMESFLFTRGHFSAKAERYVQPKRRKRAVVTYMVYPGEGHRIRHFTNDIATPDVKRIYDAAKGGSLIKEGAGYDEKLLQQERDRITRILKDSGYYHFNKAYINVEVDTFIPGSLLDVHFRILDQSFQTPGNPDEITTLNHKPSRIRRVIINPEYEGIFVEKSYRILQIESKIHENGKTVVYDLLTTGDPVFDPAMLIRNILIEPGKFYSLLDVERTYLYLSDLGNFRNITISFRDVSAEDVSFSDTSVLWIDCYINLTRELKQAYEVRMDVTNRAGDPGVATNLVYQNRNLFRGAENLGITVKGALEVQQALDKTVASPQIFTGLPFNTIELGAEADVRVPRLVAPVNPRRLPKTFLPKTRFSGGVNFQQRPDFKRYVTKIATSYEWHYRSNAVMAFSPVEVNAVSILPEKSFIDRLIALNDPRLLNSYTDHLVTAMTYTMVIDNQGDKARRRFSYTRIGLESSGLLVNALRNPLNYTLNSDGIAMIFNIPYAQYIRADVDFRRFFRLRQPEHLVAARVYLGLGNPYGNSFVLPFEKSFYVGGANGIRAWQVRSLGPGTYHDNNALTRFDRTGDLGIEASLEYRFPVYSTFHGAIFLDAGNVWLKNKNDKYPGGEFQVRNFIGEMALGTGFGLRIVSFFVIRLDAGIRVHDPSKDPDDRWVLDEFRLSRINWNFGIGYSI